MDQERNSLSALEAASKTYAEIEGVLKDAGDRLQKKEGEAAFSSERFLCQFDFLLQLVLFKTAIADGHLSEKEALAIQSIPQHGDLLDIFKGSELESPLGWKRFVNASIKELVNYTRLLDSETASLFENFFNPVALIDQAMGGEKFFLAIARSINAIANAVAGVDGLEEDSERLAAYQAIMDNVRDAYDNAVKELMKKERPDGQA
jgi:hypothetical protein